VKVSVLELSDSKALGWVESLSLFSNRTSLRVSRIPLIGQSINKLSKVGFMSLSQRIVNVACIVLLGLLCSYANEGSAQSAGKEAAKRLEQGKE